MFLLSMCIISHFCHVCVTGATPWSQPHAKKSTVTVKYNCISGTQAENGTRKMELELKIGNGAATKQCSENVTDGDYRTAIDNARCHMPDPTIVDNEFIDYDCGACPPNTDGVCKQCAAYYDSNCNTYTPTKLHRYNYTCTSGAPKGGVNTTKPCHVTGTATDEAYVKPKAICHMPDPTIVDNQFTDYDCGACPPNKKGICKECGAGDENNCNVYVPTMEHRYNYTCTSGAPKGGVNTTKPCYVTGTATDKVYVKPKAKCHMPDQSIVNNNYTDYGCGPCYTSKTGEHCLDCSAGDADNCNGYVAPEREWECYNGATTGQCRGKEVNCFRATKNYEGADNVLTYGGCGTCEAASATYTADNCTTCEEELCNSATATRIPYLATLLIAAFWFQLQ